MRVEYQDNGTAIYNWFAAMVHYDGIEAGSRTKQVEYGVIAYERVGSLEYNALAELNVRFGNDGIELLRKAYLQVKDRNIMNDNDTSRTNFSVNIEGGAAAVTVTSHLYASDSDSDSDSNDEVKEER